MIKEFHEHLLSAGVEVKSISDIKPTDKSVLIEDIRGKKTIYYTYSDTFATWYDCRRGEGGYWFPKGGKKPTAEQLAESKRRQEEAQKARIKQHGIVAQQCADRFSKLQQAGDHPYLINKGVKPEGALRVDRDLLVVPAVDPFGKIWTLQTITPEGEKSFVFGGKKSGAFFAIGLARSSKYPVIYIGEGLATMLSVYEAMDEPCVVAFDASNLSAVAKAVKDQWPTSTIVICADNDVRSSVDKHQRNDGIHYAQQAAVKVGGFVVWPELPDKTKCDFNDAHSKLGLEYVRERISSAGKPVVDTPADSDPHSTVSAGDTNLIVYDVFETPVEVYSNNNKTIASIDPSMPISSTSKWLYNFIYDKKSPPDTLQNLFCIKDYHKGTSLNNLIQFIQGVYPDLFCLNEFSDEIMVLNCPPWMSKKEESEFTVHRITDGDIINMTASLEHFGFNPNTGNVKMAIETVAQKMKKHPVRNYFNDLKWDGNPRLCGWLKKYLGSEQDQDYLERIGTMWMVAGVARIMKPGAKFDHMLVLEGKQNIGKSSVLKELATFGEMRVSYFTDGIGFQDLYKPSSMQILQGKLIVEFAEMDGMDKMSNNALKKWITQTDDELIKKWSNYVTKYPRQFILAGTTNDSYYLSDATGNRRYLPVKCNTIDIDGIKKVKEQLWAEAVYKFKEDNYKIYIEENDPIWSAIKSEQAGRVVQDPWEDVLSHYLEGKRYCSYNDVYDAIGIPIKDRDSGKDVRIRAVMRKLKWSYERDYKLTKNKGWMWVNENPL